MAKTYKTRIMQKTDTAEAWAAKNPVLLKGEIAVVTETGKPAKFKVGDGTSTYSALKFTTIDAVPGHKHQGTDIQSAVANATTAAQLGTDTVGSTTSPIYLNAGKPVAISKVAAATKADTAGACTGNAATATTATKLGTETVGSTANPIYLNAGVPTQITKVGAATKADSATTAGTCTGNAATASKLGTANVGDATHPIYLASGTATKVDKVAAAANADSATAAAGLTTFTIPTTADLNTLKGASYWGKVGVAQSGNTCTNKPGSLGALALLILEGATGYTIQVAFGPSSNAIFCRHGQDSADWAAWYQVYPQTASVVGAAPKTHTHAVADITGVLPVDKGGTGTTNGKAPYAGTADTAKTATTATTATKLGSATVGSATSPIYLNAGTPTAITKVAAATTADKATTATSATTATKLGSATVGSTTSPIYLNAGTPTAITKVNAAAKADSATSATSAKTITVTVLAATADFNATTTTGLYEIPAKPTGTGAPPASGRGILRASFMADIKSCYQEFLEYNGKTYRRESASNNASWTAWRIVGPQTVTDIGAAKSSHTHTSAQISDLQDQTTVGALGSWGKKVITSDTLAFWNGAYKDTTSNLAYCKLGAFGNIVTKSTSDFATASHTHSTYLPLTGGTVTGTLTLSKGTDVVGTSNAGPALIVGGAVTAGHLELDGNEIMAKTDATTPGGLNLNIDGGVVTIGAGGLTVKGKITASGGVTGTATAATTATKLGSANLGTVSQPIYLVAGAPKACTGVMAKPTKLTLTLTASAWSASLTQAVTATGVSATETAQEIHVMPAAASMAAYMAAGVYCSKQAANSLTFTCSTKPTANLTVYANIWTL